MRLPSDLTVKPLQLADAPALAELVARCDQTSLEWAPPGWTPPDYHKDRKLWADRLREPDRWTRGAFDRDDGLVGVVSWTQERTQDGEGEAITGIAHVSAVFVDPSRWRQRIGAALLRLAEDAMRASGFREARLWTPEAGPARRFYEWQGWRSDGRQKEHNGLRLRLAGYSKPL